MSLSTATCGVDANGNGATTVFPYAFEIPYETDGTTPAVRVTLIASTGIGTVQTLSSQFSISGVGTGAGGNVTMVTAPASGTILRIDRVLPDLQPFVVANQSFYPNTVEQSADYDVMQIQQLARDLLRAINPPCVVSALPAVKASLGMRGTVTDATVTTYGTTVAGSGSNVVPVFCNGVHWVID